MKLKSGSMAWQCSTRAVSINDCQQQERVKPEQHMSQENCMLPLSTLLKELNLIWPSWVWLLFLKNTKDRGIYQIALSVQPAELQTIGSSTSQMHRFSSRYILKERNGRRQWSQLRDLLHLAYVLEKIVGYLRTNTSEFILNFGSRIREFRNNLRDSVYDSDRNSGYLWKVYHVTVL